MQRADPHLGRPGSLAHEQGSSYVVHATSRSAVAGGHLFLSGRQNPSVCWFQLDFCGESSREGPQLLSPDKEAPSPYLRPGRPPWT